MKICPNCKKEFADYVKFCTYCGCALDELKVDAYKDVCKEEKKKAPKRTWVMIIALCLFLAFATFCYFSRTHSPENTEPETPEIVQAEQEENEEVEESVAEPEKDYEQIKQDIQFDLEHYVLSDGEYSYIFEEGGEGRILSTAFPGQERINPFYNTGTEIGFQYKIVDSQVQIIANQEVQLVLNYDDQGIFKSEEGLAAYFYLNWKEFYTEWADAAHTFEKNANKEEAYQYWDKLLNDVYGHLREHLSESDFKELKDEEIAWIRKKENAIKDAETASLKSETGAIWTEKRVYQLIEMIPF